MFYVTNLNMYRRQILTFLLCMRYLTEEVSILAVELLALIIQESIRNSTSCFGSRDYIHRY